MYVLFRFVLFCSDDIVDKLQTWIDVKTSEIENKIVLPKFNYAPQSIVMATCSSCNAKKSMLTDDHSDVMYCYECVNTTLKQV